MENFKVSLRKLAPSGEPWVFHVCLPRSGRLEVRELEMLAKAMTLPCFLQECNKLELKFIPTLLFCFLIENTFIQYILFTFLPPPIPPSHLHPPNHTLFFSRSLKAIIIIIINKRTLPPKWKPKISKQKTNKVKTKYCPNKLDRLQKYHWLHFVLISYSQVWGLF